jgi:hypothetical protein
LNDGTSKRRRLKCYLRTVDNDAATRALNALWDYREMRRQDKEDRIANAHGRFLQLLQRISGKTNGDSADKPKPAFDRAKFKELHDALLALSRLDAVRRGYDFEKFLTRLFNGFGFEPRGSWPVDDFHRIAQGHHLGASCLAFGTRSAIARRAKRTTIPEQSETLQKLAPKSKDLQSLSLPGDPAAIRLSRIRL